MILIKLFFTILLRAGAIIDINLAVSRASPTSKYPVTIDPVRLKPGTHPQYLMPQMFSCVKRWLAI